MANQGDRDELHELVRGRLSDAEAAELTARIDADPRLAAEYRLVAALGETDQAEHEFPGEFGWARLSRAIEGEVRPPIWRRQVAVWKAAAVVALIVGAYHVTATLAPALVGGANEARYVTATGVDGPAAAGPSVRVVFAPSATAAAIGALLRDVDARIVDGPSAVGFYRLAFADEAARRAAIERLRAEPSTVEVVD